MGRELTQVAPGVWTATAQIWTSLTTLVVADDGACLLVDPGITVPEVEALADEIEDRGWHVEAAFATHAHWDHVLWSARLGDVPRWATPAAAAAQVRSRDADLAKADAAAPGHDRDLFGLLTALPDDADILIREALARSPRVWGRFDVRFAGNALPLVAAAMNLRSRATGIATGDQAMFVTREAFARAGGFPDIALMEDVALSARLKRLSRPLCLAARVTTSPRRWQAHGIVRTVLLMWRLRLAFFLGADPQRLARAYGHAAD